MKLKTIITSLLFLLLSFTNYAQDYKKEITTEFTAYLDALTNLEFEKSVEYLSEDFFKIVPKEQMIQLLESTFNNPNMEIQLKDSEVVNVADKEKFDKKYYATLIYSSVMDMKINNPEEEEKEQRDLRNTLLLLNFQKTFGFENVKYDKEKDQYEIKATKEVYAISNDGETNWKFLVVEKKQRFILEQFLPQELIDRAYSEDDKED